jgi:hypothetical protein
MNRLALAAFALAAFAPAAVAYAPPRDPCPPTELRGPMLKYHAFRGPDVPAGASAVQVPERTGYSVPWAEPGDIALLFGGPYKRGSGRFYGVAVDAESDDAWINERFVRELGPWQQTSGKVVPLKCDTELFVLELRQRIINSHPLRSARVLVLDGPLAGRVVWADSSWVMPVDTPTTGVEREAWSRFFDGMKRLDDIIYRKPPRGDRNVRYGARRDFMWCVEHAPNSKWARRAKEALEKLGRGP